MWAECERVGGGGAPRFQFAAEALRALIFVTTPADARALLHAAILAVLEKEAAVLPPSAALATDMGRVAMGSNQLACAAAHYAAAARISLASSEVSSLNDAKIAAQAAIAALRALEETSTTSSRGSACFASRRSSALASRGGSGCAPRSRSSLPEDLAPEADHTPGPRLSDGPLAASAWAPADPALLPLHGELLGILEVVHSAQSSWALVKPGLKTLASAANAAFFDRVPGVLARLKGKKGCPPTLKVMEHHAEMVLELMGTVVAGQRDLGGMRALLLSIGRMHGRFGPAITLYNVDYGLGLMEALTAALGEAASPRVLATWQAVYAFVIVCMLDGWDQQTAELETQGSLKSALLGRRTSLDG